MSDLLHAALAYTAADLRVLPSDPKGTKKPLFGLSWTDATTDQAQVRRWWRRDPEANVGIACIGFVALDIDGEEGRALLAELEAVHGPLPPTRTIKTGRADGGEHRWFTISTAIEHGWRYRGCELKAKGYVLAPPSRHPATGAIYEAVDAASLVELPEWLQESPRPRTRRKTSTSGSQDSKRLRAAAEAALAGELAKLRGHSSEPGTGRHTALFAAACALGRHVAAGGLAEAEARGALQDGARAMDLADDAETAHQIENGFDEGNLEPYVLRDRDDRTSRTSTRVPAQPAGGDMTLPVIESIRRYQVIEDIAAIRAVLAVAATSVLDDEPLWLQVVGGSSSGKSEMIAMLRGVADGKIGEVTVAGLLGWSGSGQKAKPIGLLSRIGDGHKLVTITDFSTVLADSDRGRRATLFSFLRTLYDGYVIREINTAPRPLEWEGRLTIISGVTPQIDAFSAHADALGPRWMYCRVPELSRDGRKKAAALARRHASRKDRLRAEVHDRAAAAINHARDHVAGIEINDIDGDWLDDGAIVATLGRADVPRDGYGRREIIGEVSREEPPRVAIMLAILFRGLLALGVPTRTARRIALRCAIDSIPLTRRRVLDELRGGEVLTTSEITRQVGADRKVVRFALEELELLGIVASKRLGVSAANAEDHPDAREHRPREWKLDGEDGKLVARVLDEVGRNVEELSPSPPQYKDTVYGSSHPKTPVASRDSRGAA